MLTALNIRKFLAPEIIFGDGAIELVGRYAQNFGAGRVFIVTDKGIVEAGFLERAQTILSSAGIQSVVYDRVSPNPRETEVMEAAALYRQSHCDIIIALGGGSPMDCAKGVSIVSANNKHILEFQGVDNVEIPGPPLICLPTTSGSSADVSQFAIINNTADQVKIAIISKTVVPDLALLDPALTLTMDRNLTLCTGMDALVHAIEAYVSSACSQLTDIHALEAIRLIHRFLPQVLDNLNDVQLRAQVMLASLEAGLAFSNASLGAVHAMAHSLGGLLDLPHGECNALLLDAVMQRNYEAVPERYNRIGEIFGVVVTELPEQERCRAILNAIVSFKRQLGFESGLGKRGVRLEDINLLSRKALADPCLVTNPCRLELADIEAIFEEAF
ncbi:MAG: alcohol dehydrogenase-like regulatory protein ErcA [Desulfobulbus sp.]